MPARPRVGHAPDRRRADLDGPAGHGHRRPRRQGPVLHRQPGRRHHRRRPRQGAHHRRHAGPDPTALDAGYIAIVAGFQGVARKRTTSPPWAAAAPTPPRSLWPPPSDADVCEIYTDVDGVFTADPRVVAEARKIDRISTRTCWSWRPPAPRCCTSLRGVRTPLQYPDPRAFLVQRERGNLGHASPTTRSRQEGEPVEQPIISGVAHDRSEAKITVVGVPDMPGKAAADLRRHRRRRDQHRHDRAERVRRRDRPTDISFTLPKSEGTRRHRRPGDAQGGSASNRCATTTRSARSRWSAPGMRSNPGVSATFFEALPTRA